MRVIPYLGIGPSILMYHSISNHSTDPFTVSCDNFRSQLFWLKDQGFEIISLESLVEIVKQKDHTKLQQKVVLTFDDGCQDFYGNALPIIQDFHATATVFLVTDLLGGASLWNENGADVPLMTIEELLKIKQAGISLGSHTASHVNIATMKAEDVIQQLNDSKETLIRLGESFLNFSYPWGQWSYECINLLRDCGYECALVVGEKMELSKENIYCLPRITMTADIDIERFKTIMNRSRVEKELRRRYRTVKELVMLRKS